MTQEDPAPTSAQEPVPGRSKEWTDWVKPVWSFTVRCIKQVKITQLFKEILTFTTTSLLLLVLIAIIIAAYKSLNDQVVVVEPIQMPKALADRGYTPDVAAKRIIDEVVTLTTEVKSLKTGRNLVTDWDATNIQLPAVGLNFNNFTNYLRIMFGIPYTKVSGEATLTGDTYALRLRIRNSNTSPANYTTVQAKDVDDLLRSGAEEFVKGTDPYLLAFYYKDIDPLRARELITYCLQNDPGDDDVWAMNLSGVLELTNGNLDDAKQYFDKAREMDPDFPTVYPNLGFVYGMQDNKVESDRQYDTALRLGAEPVYIYNGKAIIAVKNKDKDSAQHYIELAMQTDKNNPRNYLVRSIYNKELIKDPALSVKDLKTALSLSPNYIPARVVLARFYEDEEQYEYALTQYAYLSNLSAYLAKRHKYDIERNVNNYMRQLIKSDRYAEAIAAYEKYLPNFNDVYYKSRLGDYYLSWAENLKKEADELKNKADNLRDEHLARENQKKYQQAQIEYNQKYAIEKYKIALDKYQLAIDHNPRLKNQADAHIAEIKSLLHQGKKNNGAGL